MSNQIIISIGRETGSGGNDVAKILSERLGIPLYGKNILRHVCEEKGIPSEELEKYDESPKNALLSSTINGHSNSFEQIIADMQFSFLKREAAAGKSFVVVGRCGEYVLKGHPALVSVFLLSNMEFKIHRIMEANDLNYHEAENLIIRKDKKRKSYHNSFAQGKWGDSRLYDLCIDTGKLGIENSAELILQYIELLKK